jgi:hypothetical protein
VCQFIDAYDTPWIDKSLLSLSEIDTVLRDVRGLGAGKRHWQCSKFASRGFFGEVSIRGFSR